MSSGSVELEPRLEEILHRVARDPASTLLRVPRRGALTSLLDRSETVPWSTGRGAGERELARVHASELATLLQDACAAELLDGGEKRRFISPFAKPGERVRPASTSELSLRLEQHRACSEAASLKPGPAVRLLQQCVRDTGSESPTVLQLAAAAHRLRPDPRSRVLAAADLLARNAPRACIQVSRVVLETTLSGRNALRAWECIGASHGRLDQFDLALGAYRQACTDAPESVHGWLHRFLFASLIDEQEDVRRASEWLNANLDESDEIIDWFIGHVRASRAARRWSRTRRLRSIRLTAESYAAGRISRALSTFSITATRAPGGIGPPVRLSHHQQRTA
jgi:hypothetical protein